MARGDNMVARFARSTKHLPATILMTRIAFWSKVNTVGVTHEGKKWIANSRAEWAEETGLSEKQIKDALVVLRERNMVQTTTIALRKRTALLIRQTQRGEAIAAGASVSDGADDDEASAPNGTEGWDQMGPGVGAKWDQGSVPNGTALYIQGEIQGDTQGDTQGEMGELTLSNGPEAEKFPGEVKEGNSMKVEEIAAAGVNKHLHKPDSTQALAFIWKEKVAEATSSFVHLNQKQIGQLKLIAKACPPGKAEQVLRRVLDDWIKYVKRVEQDAGAKHTPAVPNLGFLLQHVGVAVTIALPPKPTPKKQEATKGIAAPKDVQLISQQPKPQKLTKEEFHAMIYGDE